MSKKNIFVSIRTKFFLILIVSLVAAASVYGVISEIGGFMVWRYYLDEESKTERSQGYIEDFQKYVTDNKLSVDDAEKISRWSGGNYVDIIIYKDSNLMYAPDWFEKVEGNEAIEHETSTDDLEVETDAEIGSGVESESETLTEETEKNNGWFSGDRGFEQYLTQEAKETYLARLSDIMSGNQELKPVYFVDGTVLVTVVDYSEEFMDSLVFAVSIISAILVFGMIIMISFSTTVTRIKRLAQKVRRVERGELDTAIKVEGNDEISLLAADVNSMKNSVIDNMTKEQRAWEANAELITAMSHDIRTPLTIMLGYLDLLEMQEVDEANAEYINACKENALRLKRLSDDMFSYFLVFGKKEITIDLSKSFECESIMNMISERVFWLEEQGFFIEYESRGDETLPVNVDEQYFGRVLDNIVSNVEKYADPSGKLKICFDVIGAEVCFSFTNNIKTDEVKAESNGIGTKTCKRIMGRMGGSFEAIEQDGVYTARVLFPISDGTQEE